MTGDLTTSTMRVPSLARCNREGLRARRELCWYRLLSVCAVLCLLGPTACSFTFSTRPIVKIGLVGPFEGWYRARGYDALWAVRVAVQEWNQVSGPRGYSVEVVALDDHMDPHLSQRRAAELVSDPAVVGVVGHFSASSVSAARELYSSARLPLVALSAVEATGDGVFVMAPTPLALAERALDFIEDSGTQSVGTRPPVLLSGYSGEAWHWTDPGEDTVVGVELVGEGWVETLSEIRPDWVICTIEDHFSGQIVSRARDAGIQASFMGGPNWATEGFRSIAAEAGGNFWFVTGVPRRGDLREAEAFFRAFRERSGHDPGPDAILAYDATVLLLAALDAPTAGEGVPTRGGVEESLSEISVPGLTGPVEFDSLGARSGASIWVYHVE
jgi:branched-chain amino acid transport system substrate-binding protein